MKPRFSLAHLTVLHYSPPKMIELAARAGFDYVSLRPIALGTKNEPVYPLATDRTLFNDTKQALQSTGLKLLDIEMVRIYEGVDVTHYLPAFEAAAELGCNHVLTTVQTTDENLAVETLHALCELAKPFNLTLDVEFITWYELGTLTQAESIIRKVNHEKCGLLIDTLHFHRSHTNYDHLASLPKEWFHYAHLCDAKDPIPTSKEDLIYTAREDRLFLGDGDIPLQKIIQSLPDIPYSLEIPNKERMHELGAELYVKQCLESAHQLFNELS